MATDDIERLHYYQRQYLGALDFEDQQAYHRDMRRRLNLAHSWGIVTGLDLQETKKPGTNAVDIYINPGMAIDGYGREIVLFQQTQLDVSLFQPYRTVTRKWTVCLKYFENYSQRPLSGYEQCDVPNQFGRVQENYRIVLANPDPFRDDLSVAGNAVQAPPLNAIPVNPYPEDQPILPLSPPSGTSNLVIPYDESLPYQEFPVDDPATLQFAQWLIPLGQVSWDGSLQSLIQDVSIPPTPPIYVFGRRYVGAVASRLLAPARTLIVRDRSSSTTLPFKTSIELKREPPPPTPPNPDGVTMIVEGTLEVDRTLKVDGVLYAEDTIQLDGGALDFRDVNGSSDGSGTDPLFTITRRGTNTTTGIDLRVQIGKDSNGNDHFVVGSGANDLFIIADNGNAAVNGDVSITGVLDFGSKTRQMIDLWTTNDGKKLYGIGVQTNTTYFRSHNDFCWFQDGVHSDTQSDPGAGGQLQLKLDLNGDLYFGARTRQMLNLWKKNYGIGVQANTLYYRSDSDFCWFKNGSHNDAQDNPGGGTLQMKLDASGGLDVYGSHITFNSTTNFNFSVTLGQLRSGVHGSDSIYGYPNLWLDTAGAVIAKQGFRISPQNGAAFFTTGITAPNSGDVVVLNPTDGSVIPATSAYDSRVVGVAIVSTAPGFILAQQPYSSLPEGTLVALMGIVQCNVDNTGSLIQINAGDLLTTSSNQGYAQKADPLNPLFSVGVILGKAMGPMAPGQKGPIPVLIMPG